MFYMYPFPDKYQYDKRIANNLIKLADYCRMRYSKIFVDRFDLRFPQSFGDSNDFPYISRFTQKLIQKIERENIFIKYMWVRECNLSEHQHYHFIVFLDGHKIQHPYKIVTYAAQLWGCTLQQDPTGLVYYGDYMMLYRDDSLNDWNKFINMISYLAKEYSKGEIGDDFRNFSMSRLQL